jgi:2-methylcitrate dehydratase PrpD
MLAVAHRFGGEGSSSIIGGGTLAPAGAALVNGYSITAATMCDVHRGILCHITPEVVPPALALAEQLDLDGRALGVALVAGIEVAVRIGLATDYPRFRGRGWHSPGVVGPFGGAAAGASLLGLDARRTRDALAFAGSQSAGTFAGMGSSQVKFHQARGAMSGLLAALMAVGGFDAGARVLTDPDGGILRTYADGGAPERLLDGLGERWELQQISLRRWPGASALQPVIQACLELAPAASALDAVEAVRIELPATAHRMHAATGWGNQLAALQSARYVASVVLRDRRCWLEQFDAPHLADGELAEFARGRVTVVVGDEVAPAGAVVKLTLRGGEGRTARVDVPAGEPSAPLAEDEVAAKLRDAAEGTPFAARAQAVIEAVLDLDTLGSVRHLTAALRMEPSASA